MLSSVTESVHIAMGLFQWQDNITLQVIKSDEYSHTDSFLLIAWNRVVSYFSFKSLTLDTEMSAFSLKAKPLKFKLKKACWVIFSILPSKVELSQDRNYFCSNILICSRY